MTTAVLAPLQVAEVMFAPALACVPARGITRKTCLRVFVKFGTENKWRVDKKRTVYILGLMRNFSLRYISRWYCSVHPPEDPSQYSKAQTPLVRFAMDLLSTCTTSGVVQCNAYRGEFDIVQLYNKCTRNRISGVWRLSLTGLDVE